MGTIEKNKRIKKCVLLLNRMTANGHAEDLNLKMDKTNVLSISGKSEVTKEQPNGFNIFSTHVWSKQVKVPDNVDQSTISAKMTSDMNQRILTIYAELKKTENNTEENANEAEQEIPIEKLD